MIKHKLTILGLVALLVLAAMVFVIGRDARRRAAQSPKNKVVLTSDGKLATAAEPNASVWVVTKPGNTNAASAAPAPAKK